MTERRSGTLVASPAWQVSAGCSVTAHCASKAAVISRESLAR